MGERRGSESLLGLQITRGRLDFILTVEAIDLKWGRSDWLLYIKTGFGCAVQNGFPEGTGNWETSGGAIGIVQVKDGDGLGLDGGAGGGGF